MKKVREILAKESHKYEAHSGNRKACADRDPERPDQRAAITLQGIEPGPGRPQAPGAHAGKNVVIGLKQGHLISAAFAFRALFCYLWLEMFPYFAQRPAQQGRT